MWTALLGLSVLRVPSCHVLRVNFGVREGAECGVCCYDS